MAPYFQTLKMVKCMFSQRACTFKQYTPTRAVTIVEPMIGTKIRVSEAGIAYITDPKGAVLLTDLKT